VARDVWSHTTVFCGHFPEGSQVFTEEQLDGETLVGWHLRQMVDSSNIDGTPLFHLTSGNLGHQIDHHLFPRMPSNRYAEM